MRYAWIRENKSDYVLEKQAFMHPLSLIRKAYNAAFWIFLLPFVVTAIDYGMGFISFTAIIFVRLVANLYMNNALDLTPEQYDDFPLRIP